MGFGNLDHRRHQQIALIDELVLHRQFAPARHQFLGSDIAEQRGIAAAIRMAVSIVAASLGFAMTVL